MQDSDSPARQPPAQATDQTSAPTLTDAGREARAAREARSAAALRANLHRRKAQARARTGASPAATPEAEGS
jgi:hypothetical protein